MRQQSVQPSSLVTSAAALRRMILTLSAATHTSHLGSSLSCCDILLAVYNGGLRVAPERADDPSRDRLVFGKGHAATALVCALVQRGFYPFDRLLTEFNHEGGLQEHPNFRCIPGVETASGSLGHALPVAAGMALASRVSGVPYRVCAVLGDGECDEGSVWEAALFAAARQLDNLCVVVDFNRWQATGRSCEVLALEPLADKWRAFGWRAEEMDGHDPDALRDRLAAFGNEGRPLAIIAHTVKGKGVSFMEDDNNWHYRIPGAEELEAALKELDP